MLNMQNLFRYRSLFAVIFICLTFSLFYIKTTRGLVKKLTNVRQQINELKQTLEVKQKSEMLGVHNDTNSSSNQVMQSAKLLSDTDWTPSIITKVLTLIEANHLNADSVNLKSLSRFSDAGGLLVELSMSGHYQRFYQYLHALPQQNFPIYLSRLDCGLKTESNTTPERIKTNKINCKVDLLILKLPDLHARQFNKIKLQIVNNPFCKTTTNIIHQPTILQNRHFSILQMKMQGYMQNGNQVFAMIQFPNKQSMLIKKEMLIGKEQAKVMDITAQFVSVLLSGNRIAYIKKTKKE